MEHLLKYSGIVTKLRAMEAKLLKEKDFEAIASLHNVTEVVAYLKKHPGYMDLLSEVDETKIHRGDIEKMIHLSFHHDFSKLYRFSGMEQRKFLSLYFKRYEVKAINYCLRIVINRYQAPFDIGFLKPYFDRFSQLDLESLIDAKTTNQLIERLKGTEYEQPLQPLLEQPNVTLFDYDLALDLHYFISLWKERKKVLKKKELEIFTKDCGTMIDLLNIQWIYRAKKYFNMDSGDIYRLLIPIHYRIPLETLHTMIEAKDVDEMLIIFKNSKYGNHYFFDDRQTLEEMYRGCLHRLYTSDRRSHPYSIASLNTYLFLKEEEINQLTTALECIRYGLTPEETLGYVGGKKP